MESITFSGDNYHESKDISAVAVMGDYLVIGADEGHVVQILKKIDATTYKVERKYSLPDGQETDRKKKEDPELDIEGIAVNGNTVFIVGSHSSKRAKVKQENEKNRAYKKNRKRLTKTRAEKSRRVLYRFNLDENGKLDSAIDVKDLWSVILQFPVLKPFTAIPSKENGIDIEGIAAKGKQLYIGFRGPVLRNNWVPVLITEFDAPSEGAELRYVNLNGLGIRDMVSVKDGFLILAGPMGDGPGGYHLYLWNGLDCVPGKNGAKGRLQYLGQIAVDPDTKAEGMTLLPGKKDDLQQLLIVFDGPERGNPKRYQLQW
jgi:hypothetical protein